MVESRSRRAVSRHRPTRMNTCHRPTQKNTEGHRPTQKNTEGHRPTQMNTDGRAGRVCQGVESGVLVVHCGFNSTRAAWQSDVEAPLSVDCVPLWPSCSVCRCPSVAPLRCWSVSLCGPPCAVGPCPSVAPLDSSTASPLTSRHANTDSGSNRDNAARTVG